MKQEQLAFLGGLVSNLISVLTWLGLTPHRLKEAIGTRPGSTRTKIAIGIYLLSLLLTAYGFYSTRSSGFEWKGTDEGNFVRFVNQHFENERILLDGKSYIHCTFKNITFVYNGTDGVVFRDNSVSGTFRYHTDNPAVFVTAGLLKGTGQLPAVNLMGDGNFQAPVLVHTPVVVTQP